MASYSLKEGEVKMIRPKYNIETSGILDVYQTIGYIVVRGSPKEVFFNYGFDKEKSYIQTTGEESLMPSAKPCLIDIGRWLKVASWSLILYTSIFFCQVPLTGLRRLINI